MRAFCPTCILVDAVDDAWRCLWCGTVTLATLKPDEGRESRTVSISRLRALHERYALGESLASLARDSYTGRDTLKENFWAAGLPTRTMAASNALEGPRRRVVRHLGERNGAYRSDLCDHAVLDAYRRLKSLRAAADHLGCGIATVHRRLKLIDAERNPVGRNQHSRA